MLIGANDLTTYRLHARDGELGRLHDVSFDEISYQVRHLIVDTGGWLARRIPMHPLAIQRWNHQTRSIELTVTRSQVKNSPTIDADQPLSHRQAEQYYRYFGWPAYWPSLARGFTGAPARAESGHCDPHLHSVCGLLGWQVQARDDQAGRVDDVLLDAATWTLRQVAVDVPTCWLSKQALISVEWIKGIDWSRRLLLLDLDLDHLDRAPLRQRHAPAGPVPHVSLPGR